MQVDEYKKIAYGEWFEHVPFSAVKDDFAKNIEKCKRAIEYHNKKDRPLEILLVHGSGRSSFASCAHERSNSQLLLTGAVEQFKDDPRYNITDIRLRDYNISPCNACYSTTSALCNFPCSCFPIDPMQDLYPLVLKCDVMLCSTGVNQSAMASRLKLFADRLISLDGGFYISAEQFVPKTSEFRDQCIKTSIDLEKKGDLPYDARMWGRAAAYFITSKDQNNTHETITHKIKSPLNYVEMVAWSLFDGFADYGFFHADPWYVGAAAEPDEEMSHDKEHYHKHLEYLEKAKEVAKTAVELGEELRKNPPPFDGGARTNRT